MEARKSARAGTGSAAISTANNGTNAGVLALARNRWYSKPWSICTDEAGVPCPNPRLAERVIRFMGRKIMVLTTYFKHSVGFRSEIDANLMHDVCSLTRDGRRPLILAGGLQFSRLVWSKTCLFMEAVFGFKSSELR